MDGGEGNGSWTMSWTRARSAMRSRTSLGLMLTTSLALTACGASAGLPAPSPSPTADQHASAFQPNALALDREGNLYASDCYGGYVYKIGGSGQLTVVAGIGPSPQDGGLAGEGGPAVQAQLACPYGLTFDSNGELVLADHANNRIRRIGRDVVIRTSVGSGPVGSHAGSFGGDGGAAIQANLRGPVSVLFDANGNLYIGDRDNGAIRKVTPDGTITTFVGTGTRGYGGDGGPAIRAQLDQPEGMVFDAAGNLYFADSANNRIRRVDARGTITTIAGTGSTGYSGDGGPASKAQMQPDDLVFDPAGNLYIAEGSDHVIRVMDAKGVIRTVAGTGKEGCSGYGGHATSAQLGIPLSPVLDSMGNLFFADGRCHVVLKVENN